jgi:hypothetical protein
MTDDEQPEPVRYTYKPSVAGSPQSFELSGEGLSIHTGFRASLWRYGDIAQIRLSYRPVSMLAHRFRADLRHKDGRKIRIVSATWSGIVALTPQNDSYRAFMQELHRCVAAEQGGVVCLAGLPRVRFTIAVAVFAALMLGLAGLLVRALVTAELAAALFLLGFAAWTAWYIGGWLKRNQPHPYEPASVPKQLLP